MADAQHFDVVIIGAGIAGAALAAALSGEGLSIALVEARLPSSTGLPTTCGVHDYDARVSALTPRSQTFLQQLGAWEAIAAYRYCSYQHMTVWDAEGTGQIEFDRDEVNVSALGHIVENRSLVRALLERVVKALPICIPQLRLAPEATWKGNSKTGPKRYDYCCPPAAWSKRAHVAKVLCWCTSRIIGLCRWSC